MDGMYKSQIKDMERRLKPIMEYVSREHPRNTIELIHLKTTTDIINKSIGIVQFQIGVDADLETENKKLRDAINVFKASIDKSHNGKWFCKMHGFVEGVDVTFDEKCDYCKGNLY